MIGAILLSTLTLSPSTPVLAPGGNATPDGAIVASVRALRRNDIMGFLSATFPEAELSEMRRTWDRDRRKKPTTEEAVQFAQTMALLTAPGAEKALMSMVEPKLAELRPQMGMMVGMISGMAQSAMEQNDTLTAKEKAEAREVLAGVTDFLGKADIGSSKNAEKAIGILCRTARRMKLETLDDVSKLSFPAAVGKGNIALAGVKDMLAVYGVPVDQWLDSVHAETVAVEGKSATVRISFEIFGSEQTVDTEMVNVAGRWIRKEFMDAR